MIHHSTEDIFKMDVEAIVNPMNCVGIMGRGLALQFKKKFPDNFIVCGIIEQQLHGLDQIRIELIDPKVN